MRMQLVREGVVGELRGHGEAHLDGFGEDDVRKRRFEGGEERAEESEEKPKGGEIVVAICSDKR